MTVFHSPDTQEVAFDEVLEYGALGLNGAMHTRGLYITRLRTEICIQPVTSKGNIGRAAINLPIDKLPDLIDALRRLST